MDAFFVIYKTALIEIFLGIWTRHSIVFKYSPGRCRMVAFCVSKWRILCHQQNDNCSRKFPQEKRKISRDDCFHKNHQRENCNNTSCDEC